MMWIDLGVAAFSNALGDFVRCGGILTDELREPLSGPGDIIKDTVPWDDPNRVWRGQPWPWSSPYPWLWLSWTDIRQIPEQWSENPAKGALDEPYLGMQGARAVVSTALWQLATARSAAPAVVQAYRGELYALEGYAEVLLADLFCSGVPLNTFAEDSLKKVLALGPSESGPLEIPGYGTITEEKFASASGSDRWFNFWRNNLGTEFGGRQCADPEFGAGGEESGLAGAGAVRLSRRCRPGRAQGICLSAAERSQPRPGRG